MADTVNLLSHPKVHLPPFNNDKNNCMIERGGVEKVTNVDFFQLLLLLVYNTYMGVDLSGLTHG